MTPNVYNRDHGVVKQNSSSLCKYVSGTFYRFFDGATYKVLQSLLGESASVFSVYIVSTQSSTLLFND